MLQAGHHPHVRGTGAQCVHGHDICVYNMDYKVTEQVMRVENLMRSAGVTTILSYKPDIFSALGIYRNNKWGFRPMIYRKNSMSCLECSDAVRVVNALLTEVDEIKQHPSMLILTTYNITGTIDLAFADRVEIKQCNRLPTQAAI